MSGLLRRSMHTLGIGLKTRKNGRLASLTETVDAAMLASGSDSKRLSSSTFPLRTQKSHKTAVWNERRDRVVTPGIIWHFTGSQAVMSPRAPNPTSPNPAITA